MVRIRVQHQTQCQNSKLRTPAAYSTTHFLSFASHTRHAKPLSELITITQTQTENRGTGNRISNENALSRRLREQRERDKPRRRSQELLNNQHI